MGNTRPTIGIWCVKFRQLLMVRIIVDVDKKILIDAIFLHEKKKKVDLGRMWLFSKNNER